MPNLAALPPLDAYLAGKVGMTTAGFILLIIAFKVGRFLLKIVMGLIALALLAGAAWWFLVKQ